MFGQRTVGQQTVDQADGWSMDDWSKGRLVKRAVRQEES